MATAEQPVPSQLSEAAQLPPHTYPLWVVAAAVLTVVAALYAFTRVPTLVDAGHNLRSGRAALARGDYTAAIAQLERAHDEVPSSRKVTIFLATADFGAGRPQDALELLRGRQFTPSEWSTLTQTMPASIQALSQPTS